MPVTLIDSGRRPGYLNPEDEPENRARQADAVASLAQAYQNFQSNKRDRRLMDELIQESPTGPLAQARQQAQGGGPLNRIRSHFQSGQPLSPMEQLMMKAELEKRFGDPYGVEKAKANYYNARAGAGGNKPLPEGFIWVNGKPVKDPNYTSPDKPLTGDVGGRVTLGRESLRNLPNLKSTFFPDGTAESFRRDIATKLAAGKFPNDKDAQNAYRWLGSMLSGRQLIQTGVAARPDETKNLIKQFGIDFLSNPESALQGLDELETFYGDFIKDVAPQKKYPELVKKDPFKIGQTLQKNNKTYTYKGNGQWEES